MDDETRARATLTPSVWFFCHHSRADTMGLFYAADVRACEEVGLRMSKEVFYRLAGVPIREIFRRLAVEQGKDMTAHELDVMVDRCGAFAHELGTPKAIECVIDVAREAKARGLRVGVASSGVKTTVMKHLREHGLLDLFECVVTCEDVEHGKPAPDLYALAAKTLGVAPERCVAYEDAELGIESALAAGYARCVDVRKMSKYEPTDYLSGGNEP